ncbi:kinase-like domain-containing protein [Gigaspora rosea]|uniref:Kinase-like domain-containing protein n=1 Tax=Gigaspora rosea TaxID=44941 RepID=A0A397V4Y5_9GLOM|nr:kinase-like domain-containing protein [Gigaspora rosea]
MLQNNRSLYSDSKDLIEEPIFYLFRPSGSHPPENIKKNEPHPLPNFTIEEWVTDNHKQAGISIWFGDSPSCSCPRRSNPNYPQEYRPQNGQGRDALVCKICDLKCDTTYWCRNCDIEKLKRQFRYWTSGNQLLDEFVQRTQLDSRSYHEYFEWIEPVRLRNIEHIADGGNGSVYKAEWIDGIRVIHPKKGQTRTKSIVALKVISCGDDIEILTEISRIYRVRNDLSDNNYGPKIYGFTKHVGLGKYALVMQYFENGSLRTYLQKHKEIRWIHLAYLASSISKGLKTMHSDGVVHCDLHSGNILVGYNSIEPSCCIADYGTIKKISSLASRKCGIYGVIPYMAPELFKGQPHSTATDIYAFGMIMWELSAGEPPFNQEEHNSTLMLNICDGLRPSIVEGTPDCWVQLMKRCWDSDPKKRPIASELEDLFEEWVYVYGRTSEFRRKCKEADEYRANHPRVKPKKRHSGATYASSFIQLPIFTNREIGTASSTSVVSIEGSKFDINAFGS